MASHLYIPPQCPGGTPRSPLLRYLGLMWQILLAHALEVAVATYSSFSGFVLTVSTLTGAYDGEDSVLPPYLVLGMGLFLGFGGLLVLIGVFVRRHNIRAELNIEQIGWIIQTAGWASYCYVAIRYAGGSPLALAASLCMVGGGIVRTIALLLLERRLEKVVIEGGDDEEPTREDLI